MTAKRMLPPTYLLLGIATMAALHILLPVAQVLVLPWRLLGLLPLLLGLALNVVADRQFKQAKTTVKPFQRSSALVTNGAYRICRHPMYLGFVLILSGMAILTGSLSPFVVVPAFAVLVEVVFIREEERMMAAEFGDAWLAYKEKVRRWL
jgi:protein-S-isoprenylcysteine O-methyltransferase Ste14